MITIVEFNNFMSIIVIGKINHEDWMRVKEIKDSMSSDDYAEYSPAEQMKYESVKLLLSKYKLSKEVMWV